MSSTVSSAAWLHTALPPAAADRPDPSGGTAGRHRAPEAPGPVEPLTSEQIARSGRHAAPEDGVRAQER
jgi:hypothetical protein